jgi:hypothetical protein
VEELGDEVDLFCEQCFEKVYIHDSIEILSGVFRPVVLLVCYLFCRVSVGFLSRRPVLLFCQS